MSEPMTTVGPDEPDRAGRPPRRRRRWWVVAGLALALAAAAVVVVVLRDGEDLYPQTWAKEVLPFVEVVEEERGLEFEHPVYVEFLPPDEFEQEVTADEDDLTEEDEAEIEQTTGMMRAVGLIEGDVDLFEAFNGVTGPARWPTTPTRTSGSGSAARSSRRPSRSPWCTS